MTTRTTAEERQALRKLEAAATPGPWVQWVEHAEIYRGPVKANTPGRLAGSAGQLCAFDAMEYPAESEEEATDAAMADAKMIATTRNALPALLADLEDALAEVARLRRAIEHYRSAGKWAAGYILDLLPPDAVPPDIMGMLYRADNEADPGTHPEDETAEVPTRTAELEAEVARQAAVIERVRGLAEGCQRTTLALEILAAIDETEADRG